ncbi:hypothetical protein BC938DRAFT_483566 [Jimgerdemannia flammicorona]|uniref:FAD-binding domain-containing protein n=1 Tax=Jimgerdemannia flammicorona TaxID=994334 RepID=A0A433QVV0_9FUNG|nr:hypothetical protein BC938DRAFT_483566 [Jimgerdemannia flammicorona]
MITPLLTTSSRALRPLARRVPPAVSRRILSHHAPTLDLTNLYDVVIVGGGVAGTALACALASSPVSRRHRVALIEAQDLKGVEGWAPGAGEYSNRCSSITPASYRFFKEIGVWDKLLHDRIHPYQDMQVRPPYPTLSSSFTFANLYPLLSHFSPSATTVTPGAPAIAWMVENLNLQRGILRQLDELRGEGAKCDVFAATKVKGITKGEAVGEGGEEGLDLSEWPIVGADGVNSPVRTFAGIDSLGWDYDRHGVVATLRVDEARDNGTAWQRFLPTGPIAILPVDPCTDTISPPSPRQLGPGHSSLVWSTTPRLASALRTLPPSAFTSLINVAFRSSMPDLRYLLSQTDAVNQGAPVDFGAELAWREEVETRGMDESARWEREMAVPPLVTDVADGSRAVFPLRMRNAERYVGKRVVLVGRAMPGLGSGGRLSERGRHWYAPSPERLLLSAVRAEPSDARRRRQAAPFVRNRVCARRVGEERRAEWGSQVVLEGSVVSVVSELIDARFFSLRRFDSSRSSLVRSTSQAEIMRYAMGIEPEVPSDDARGGEAEEVRATTV